MTTRTTAIAPPSNAVRRKTHRQLPGPVMAPAAARLEKMLEFRVYATVSEDAQAISAANSQNGLVSPGTSMGKQIAGMAAMRTGQPEKEQRKFKLFARA